MYKKLISYYFILLLLMTSCIVEYKPTLETIDTKQYVIDGKVTNQEGYQVVKISYSSEIKTDVSIPEYIPISNCDVIISDDNGNEFILTETDNPGEYNAWIDKEFLTTGTSYKIDITTPQGIKISSDYDMITECADIDSVYFKKEDILTTNPDEPIQGIQYYTDLSGMKNQSPYYKLAVEETWEYHVRHPNEGYIEVSGNVVHIEPPDKSKQICWKTQLVPEIFILSTEDLSENKYVKFPLHHVNTTTTRLEYGYNVTVKQYSLTKKAYDYWIKVKNNFISEGGLYNTQPEQVKGNLYSVTNPELNILGYFYATSVKSKSVFTGPIEGLDLYYSDHCVEHILMFGARSIHLSDRPAYLLFYGPSPTSWLGDDCVDCTLQGGVTTKPDFWPY